MCVWGREIQGVGGRLQDACVTTGCRASLKEWVMEETFKTKLLSASRFHAHAQPKNLKNKFNIAFLCAPPQHISIQCISHKQATTFIQVPQIADFGTDRQSVCVNQLCVSCMPWAWQRQRRVEFGRRLLHSFTCQVWALASLKSWSV